MKYLKKVWKNQKDLCIYAMVVLVAGLLLFSGRQIIVGDATVFGRLGSTQVYRAKVELILARNAKTYEIDGRTLEDSDIHFYAKIVSGDKKGETLIVRQINNAMLSVPLKEVEEGDRIMMGFMPYESEGEIWIFQEYDRSLAIGVLLAAFLGLMLLFGGKKGIGAILSVGLTCLCIFYFFLPAILAGWNIYVLTFLSCLFVIAVTLILVNGFNFKSLSAAIGCIGGLLVAGILFFVSDASLKLTGLIDEDSSYLIYMNPDNPIDLKAIIFASILIGVLGAVLDVGVSIVASLNEVYSGRQGYTFRDVAKSGMNIGRDIISTMTNTIILAYIGGGLSVTLLFMTYSNSFFELINRETIVVELLQALLGSIGLLFTIPLTTVFYAFALTYNKKQKSDQGKKAAKETGEKTEEHKKTIQLESVARLQKKENEK